MTGSTDAAAPPSVADLLRLAARQHPDSVAVDGDGRRLTHAELAESSNRVATALLARGLESGDRIAYLDRNGTEYWEVYLGAMKAGIVLVPLNFRLGRDELRWALADSGARLLVVGQEFAETAAAVTVPALTIGVDGPGGFAEWVAGGRDEDPRRDVGGGDCVQLIYSSGTTGRPKGLLIGSAQLAWATAAFSACFDVDHHSRSLVPIPYYHVAGGGWAMITLTKGGTVIQSREPTAATIFDQLVRYRATHAAMVPAVMQVLTASPDAATADFSALRQLVYGGSPISEPLVRACIATFGAELFQSYGLSETIGVTTLLGPADHGGDLSRLRSAGRPVPGVRLEIRDAVTGAQVGAGVSGEVVVKAPGVTAGYWHRPEETAEAFTSDGYFRTGDVGYLDADGYLYLRDRIKDMIVTGGENVYPAEVESVLAGHPAVADVAVIGVPSDRWGETPLAVVVPRGPELDVEELLDWARQRMAHFKAPTAVVTAAQLPRNPSGKILKRELRQPYWVGRDRTVG